jgi:hypothetical protein
MRRILIIGLIFYYGYATGQNKDLLKFEKIAVDFFADSICNRLTKAKIYYDGSIFNREIDTTYVDYLINDFYFFKLQKLSNPHLYQKYNTLWQQSFTEFQLSKNQIKIDSFDYTQVRLQFHKPIIFRNQLKYTQIKDGIIRSYIRRLDRLFFKQKFNLNVTRSVKFGDYHWVRIQQDRPDWEYGITYIFLIKDDGQIFDYIHIPWIQ